MKRMKKTLALLLILALTLCSFASCSGKQAAMRYGDQTLDESDYAYLMAFIKGYYEYYYQQMGNYYGTSFDIDQMYDREIEDGKTFAQILTETVTDAAKMLLVVEQLCKDANLTVTDAESLSQVEDAMQQLRDSYGGADAFEIELAKLGLKPSSVERYEMHNLLLEQLREYRYGENGVARVAESEVKKSFLENYVKAEGYLYSYVVTNSNGTRAMYEYDFASDFSSQEVQSYFAEHMLKVSYLRFKQKSDAEAAYTALSGGTGKIGDYADAKDCVTKTDAFVSDQEFSETLLAKLTGAAEDTWVLSDEEDSYYYVILRKPLNPEELKGDVEKTVRSAMVDRDARAYFSENYVTVRHILYKTEEEARPVYEAILNGSTTFADHEKETQDSGVQYTFTKGTMDDAFEEASYALTVGQYTLVESQFGWHIITRLELDENGYDRSDAVAAMSRDLLREQAQKQYADLSAGNASFAKPEDGALYSYSEPDLLELASQNEELASKLKDAKEGEFLLIELDGYGVFVLKKHEPTDDDFKKVYDEVEEPLIDDAMITYIQSFYDAIVVNQAVLDRFDVRTASSFYY